MNFEEKIIERLKRLEREVERLRVKESPDMSSYLGITAKAADSAKLGGVNASDLLSGWIPASGWKIYQTNWVNNVTGAQTLYSVGDKIKFTEGGSTKYFYVVSAPTPDSLKLVGDTTVGAAGTALTNIYYSHATSPVGFPQWFDYTPILTVSGGTAPTYSEFVNRYCMVGKMVTVTGHWYNTSGGTAGAGTNPIITTLPITAADRDYFTGSGFMYQVGGLTTGIFIYMNSTTQAGFNQITMGAYIAGNDQSNATRYLSATFTYEAA